ncbi:MAG TPA: hypothetical protein VNO34_01300 [Actinomycetota bacterium]|nr:hypothetical protein [Actinomycetota bacterium]
MDGAHAHSGGLGQARAPWDPLGPGLTGCLALVPRSARWLVPALLLALGGGERSRIDPRARTLALLRVACVERSPYWRVRLERTADSLGIGPEEVEVVESDDWELTPALEPRERAAVLWADRVARRLARRDRRAHDEVRRWFDDEGFVELTLAASLTVMACRLANALRLEDSSEASGFPSPVPTELLRSWSGQMFDGSLFSRAAHPRSGSP